MTIAEFREIRASMKRCPYCGKKPTVYFDGWAFHAMCKNPGCLTHAGVYNTSKEAINAWNAKF